jgi:hypothetical protein
MNFADQEMHYGAPIPSCAAAIRLRQKARRRSRLGLRVRCLADANHFQGALAILPGVFPDTGALR